MALGSPKNPILIAFNPPIIFVGIAFTEVIAQSFIAIVDFAILDGRALNVETMLVFRLLFNILISVNKPEIACFGKFIPSLFPEFPIFIAVCKL